MADIIGLERTISRASGFDAEAEMKKVLTLPAVDESRPASGTPSTNATLTSQNADLEKSEASYRQEAWDSRPGQKDPNAVY